MKMANSQKKGSGMSAGRRIDDHSFWAGKGDKHSIMPKGVHVKEFPSAGSAGDINRYDDISENIKQTQEEAKSRVKGHPQKPMYRN
jgi:hypothetical protein